jgi:hypothetical protein
MKTWLFFRLFISLDNTAKSSRALLTAPTESVSAQQNIIRSSTMHK